MANPKPVSGGGATGNMNSPGANLTPSLPSATMQPIAAVQPRMPGQNYGQAAPKPTAVHPVVMSAIQQYHPELYGPLNDHLSAKPNSSAGASPVNPGMNPVQMNPGAGIGKALSNGLTNGVPRLSPLGVAINRRLG